MSESKFKRLEPELIIDALRKRWLVLLVPLVFVPVAALTTRHVVGPKLKVSALILVQENSDVNPVLRDLLTDLPINRRLPEISSMLLSRQTVDRVLRRMGEIDESTTEDEAYAKYLNFRAAIEVFGEGGGLIRVGLVGRSPEKLARGLKLLTQALIEETLRPQREALDRTVKFLEPQLERVKEELASIEAQMRAFKKENANYLPEVRKLKVVRHAELSKKVLEAEAARVSAERTLALIEQRLSRYSPAESKAQSRLSSARSRLRQLRKDFTDQHPQVLAQQERVSKLEAELKAVVGDREEVRRFLSRGKLPDYGEALAEAEGARETSRFLAEQYAASTEELKSFASYEQTVNQLERTYDAKSKSLANLLARYEDAVVTRELVGGGKGTDIRIVELNTRPSVSSKSSFLFVAIGSVLGGFVFGLGLVVLLELLDRSVRTQREAERAAGVPILGTLAG